MNHRTTLIITALVSLALLAGCGDENFFNPDPMKEGSSTEIGFAVPEGCDYYTLIISSMTGHEIRRFTGAAQAGAITITWDHTGNGGVRVIEGTYLMELTACDHYEAKVIVVRND